MNFVAFLISTLLATTASPLVIALYTKRKWLDDPSKNPHPKVVHTKPLPRGGGLVIFLSIFIATLLFIPIDKRVVGILLGALVLMATGFWDDIASPPPIIRLLLQIVAAFIVVASGIGIAYITNPFGGIIHFDTPQLIIHFLGMHTLWVLSDIFGLIWIVWCMNIVNFSKGLDGQMPGYVSIAAFFIALLSLRFHADPSQIGVTTLSLIVSGAFLGFLFWNKYPQKIMSGFGASTLGGYFLAILSILSGAKLATAILVLAVPMIDALFVILGRIRRGQVPLMGDRTHLHHKLMDLGWGKRKIAAFYWFTTAVLGVAALQLNSEQKLFTIVLVGTLILGFLVWFRFFITSFGKSDLGSG